MIYKITLPGRTLPIFAKTLAAACRLDEVKSRVNYPVLAQAKEYPYTSKHGVTVEKLYLSSDTKGVWMLNNKDHYTNAFEVLVALINNTPYQDIIDLIKFLEPADLNNPNLFYTCDSFKLIAAEVIK